MTLARFKAQNHPQQVDRGGAVDDVDDRATHPLDFAEFDERFGPFTVDVAAAPHNARCDRYFTRDDDGLTQSWNGETVWCNPPYSDITPWVRKAWAEHTTAESITMLLPANRTEQSWWQHMVEPFRDRVDSPLSARFLAGRMRFLRRGQTAIGPNERPPFGCVLLRWSAIDTPNPLVYRPDDVHGGLFEGTA